VRLISYERRTEAETAERRTIKRRLQHGYFHSPFVGDCPARSARTA